jgi:hypothetical protein
LNDEALAREAVVSIAIGSRVRLVRMLRAVNLDDDAMLQAGEIHDEAQDRHLATEMKPGLPQSAQCNPELRLMRRQAFSQTAGNVTG